jgi:hypothetical protein
VARADGDERASEALVAFGTHLNGDDLVRALRMSLPEWNENAMDEWTRTLGSLFAAEARRSPEFADDSFGIWHELLGAASRDGRPGALRFLACFAPWLAVIAPPNVIDDIFDAAIAVRVEWP